MNVLGDENMKLPIEGSAKDAQIVRFDLGFEGGLLKYDRATLKSVLGELSLKLESVPYVRLIDVCTLLNSVGEQILIEALTLGYYVNVNNCAYSHIGFFCGREFVETLKAISEEDDEIFMYICDWEKDIELSKVRGDLAIKEARAIKPLARIDAEEYIDMLMLRYPREKICDSEKEWFYGRLPCYVQIRHCFFGDRSGHLTAILAKIVERLTSS